MDTPLFKKAERNLFVFHYNDDDDESHFLAFLRRIKITEYDL